METTDAETRPGIADETPHEVAERNGVRDLVALDHVPEQHDVDVVLEEAQAGLVGLSLRLGKATRLQVLGELVLQP